MRAFLRILCVFVFVFPASAGPLVLQRGDRVAFFGDSITQQRLYTRFVEEYGLTRFPDWKLTFVNAGWGGDRTPPGAERMARDVLALHPDVVAICYGMNDGRYRTFQEADLDRFLDGYRRILDGLAAAGARPVLLSNGPVDTFARKGSRTYDESYNQTLGRFAEATLALARERGLPAVNLHALMHPLIHDLRESKSPDQMFPDDDPVHPNPAGHLVMACALLTALGAPALVSEVSIQLSGDKPQADAENCSVASVRLRDGVLTFSRKDRAWPWYIPEVCRFMLSRVPVEENFNRYLLRVSGLPAGRYEVAADGAALGRWDSAALAAGINLASTSGPWMEAGKRLDALALQKSNVYFDRWRVIQLGLPDHAGKAATLRAMDRWIGNLESDMRNVAQPRTTRWSITPAR